jgi:hypothetical protein
VIEVINRTGRAMGTLSAIIYFERSDGMVILPVFDAGRPELARMIFERKYKNHPQGERWEWREASTLTQVDQLQKRLVEQEQRRDQTMLEQHYNLREQVRRDVRDSLYQRMISSGTSDFEREAIRYYLDARDDPKRDKFRATIEHHNYYLWAREMNPGTKVEDRMPMQPGEFYRTEQQQRD